MGQITAAKGCPGLSKLRYSMLTHQPDLVFKVTMIAHNTCPIAIRVVLNTYHMTTLKKNNKVRTVGSCDTLGKLASKCVGIEYKDIISAWFNGSPETAVGEKSGVALHAQKMMAFLQGEQVKLELQRHCL